MGKRKLSIDDHYLSTFWKHTKYTYIWGLMAIFLFLLPPDVLELLKLESSSWLCMVSPLTLALSVFLPSLGAPVAHGELCRTRSTSRWHWWAASSLFCLVTHLLSLAISILLNLGKLLQVQYPLETSSLVSLFLHLIKIDKDSEDWNTIPTFTCLAHSLVLPLCVHFLWSVAHIESHMCSFFLYI